MTRCIRKLGSFYLHEKSTYYFISFPKSGRTWIKSFLANYYSICLQIPLFYNFSPVVRWGKRSNVPRIIFTHPSHRGESDKERQKDVYKLRNKKVVLLIRDPERVVFTYYYRLLNRMHDSKATAMTMKEFIRDPDLGIAQIVTFMNYWYESRRNFKDFILVRYEDCVKNPEEEFEKILHFLETTASEKEIAKALSLSVDTTRKIEQKEFVTNGSLQSDISKGSEYFESYKSSGCSSNECDRYSGNEMEFQQIFTSGDRQYIASEIARLSQGLRL